MWLFLIDGFYSVVEDKDDPSVLLVRARDKDDAHRMAARLDVTVEDTNDREHDYPYRMRVDRSTFAGELSSEVMDLDYTNFKDRVHSVRGFSRSLIYSRVWSWMIDALQGHSLDDH